MTDTEVILATLEVLKAQQTEIIEQQAEIVEKLTNLSASGPCPFCGESL